MVYHTSEGHKKDNIKKLFPLQKIKKSISHKPDSVIPIKSGRPSFIWLQHYCCNLAAYPSARAGRPQTLIYVALQHTRFTRGCILLCCTVSSYLTFSPSFRRRRNSYFLWHCLLPVILRQAQDDKPPAVNRCVALCCPDFPFRINTER